MEKKVLLQIYSLQQYEGEEEAQTSELTTVGTLRQEEDHLCLSYEETELTGLKGTTTSFCLYGDKIFLKREGTLQSEMLFDIGTEHRSLYDMGMGAMMITVRTMAMIQTMTPEGGMISVDYDLLVEDCYVGQVSYRILVTPTGEVGEE
ncbi:MAG: DUF1934 domain-containing protein [Oscillospiraceae bacterium]|nr:DUF1934 domain-containing protein [Oscillospiraceae bacterium]